MKRADPFSKPPPPPSSGPTAEHPHYDSNINQAREFDDGTYHVTPKVFGTYSNNPGSYQGEGGSRGQADNEGDTLDQRDRESNRTGLPSGQGNFREQGNFQGYDTEGGPRHHEEQCYRDTYPPRGDGDLGTVDYNDRCGQQGYSRPPEGGRGEAGFPQRGYSYPVGRGGTYNNGREGRYPGNFGGVPREGGGGGGVPPWGQQGEIWSC